MLKLLFSSPVAATSCGLRPSPSFQHLPAFIHCVLPAAFLQLGAPVGPAASPASPDTQGRLRAAQQSAGHSQPGGACQPFVLVGWWHGYHGLCPSSFEEPSAGLIGTRQLNRIHRHSPVLSR
jgi:hypothetical protein